MDWGPRHRFECSCHLRGADASKVETDAQRACSRGRVAKGGPHRDSRGKESAQSQRGRERSSLGIMLSRQRPARWASSMESNATEISGPFAGAGHWNCRERQPLEGILKGVEGRLVFSKPLGASESGELVKNTQFPSSH